VQFHYQRCDGSGGQSNRYVKFFARFTFERDCNLTARRIWHDAKNCPRLIFF